MATIKIEFLTSKTLADDRHPIYITVRKDNTVRRKSVGSALPAEWDEDKKIIKKRKNHVADTIYIEDEYAKYYARFKELDRSGKPWSADDVFEEKEPGIDEESFFQVAEAYLNSLEKDSVTYDGVKSRFEKVKRYSIRDFKISDIDNKWIAGFINHCKTKEKNREGGIGNSKNTINHAFRFIKRIVSYAGTDNKALRKHKLHYDKNIRSKLTAEEIKAISNLKLNPDTLAYHSRNIFLVQYYFRGMRIGDALRLEISDFFEGRLKYDANKTGNAYDMKVVAPCMEILNEYLDKPSGYVFPLLRIWERKDNVKEFKQELKNRTMIVNRHLKDIAAACGITKSVSTHIARHSFASIADKHLGGDLKTLQGLFGHSSRKITEIYIRDLRKTDELDDAADDILG